ncbi:MAG: YggT family protein [Candidatus Eremiobacteraeota bacterium]|nr:YggT family protein [Candidatus Eremiobacteraeota bacterium]
MNGFLCIFDQVMIKAVNIYSVVLFVYAVLSWFPDLRRWQAFLAPLIEPVLNPIRRIIPPMGGLDLAFLVLILVLQVLVRPLLNAAAFNACSPF